LSSKLTAAGQLRERMATYGKFLIEQADRAYDAAENNDEVWFAAFHEVNAREVEVILGQMTGILADVVTEKGEVPIDN